jgi:hypothetical protein
MLCHSQIVLARAQNDFVPDVDTTDLKTGRLLSKRRPPRSSTAASVKFAFRPVLLVPHVRTYVASLDIRE